ncbi:General substrate transporter [Gloeothece citriformis PCC 7424]|uniref:General substrate transporter n=1 Tax=Gloeothece citriformis (strain PCC 7424) TaxID=65393 RepID=B7KAG0_GLOC7|nr:MFS transporter [Gloeothece citriformis]ACK72934.1 General substrate transporter [Gloeothece citriformis PCC 7424]
MTTITQPTSFEERLNQSKITPTMWLLWALSAGLIALDGFDFFIIGVALPFLQRDFSLTAVEIAAVAVAAVSGSLLGSLTLGPVTDKIGRQVMLLVDVAIFVIATAGTALAWNGVSLIIFRFLVGIGIGADYPISVSYITENVPSRLRGRMVIGAFTFQAFGAFLGAITGLFVIHIFNLLYPDSPQPAIQYAWRWMLGVGLLLAIAVGILRLSFLLESPRYYIARGEYEEASKAASTLLDEPINITPETDPPQREPNLPYWALFASGYRQRTILASVPWFLQDIATYGIGIFTPAIIGVLAFAREDNFMAREMASAKGSAFVDLFLIAGFIMAVILIEPVGRMKLQIIGFLGMAIGLLILAASNSLGDETNITLVFCGFLVFNLMMNAGPNSTTFLLSGEIFPTSIRASGAGFAAAFAKAGAVVGTFALPLLQNSLGTATLLIVLSLLCVLAAIITYFYRIETGGRSLEAVDQVEFTQ